MIPREVATFGRYAARRTGLDPDDGESIAGETWAAYPTQEGLWRTITMRRCVDEARHRHGRRDQHPTDLPILDAPLPTDEDPPDRGADDPNLAAVEDRNTLATILANLDDHDLAALARHYWLGLPNPSHSPAEVACTRALRRARAAAGAPPASPLTPRQTHMLRLVADGNANRKIAAQLGISVNTVNGALVSVLRRLEANDRAHAVALAIRAGLIA